MAGAPTRTATSGVRCTYRSTTTCPTILSTAAGVPGGIFSPSLATGAGLGNLLATIFPADPRGPVVLLGMIAYFTGVVRAPLTAVIIIVEVTASKENPPNEIAKNLADGNVNTKWFAGATTGWATYKLAEPTVVVAYALGSANDSPGRDPNLSSQVSHA